MKGALKTFGNESGVIIPRSILSKSGLSDGDDIRMTVEAGRIVIERAASHPRAGWAEDARQIAEAGDDGPEWPEFSNDDDSALKW